MDKKVERIGEACDRLLEMFNTGQLPPAVARTTIQALTSDVPCAKWSLGNQLLTFLAGTTDARGFRQWEEAGRRVKKGARAFYILGPCTRRVTEEKTDDEGQEIREERVIVTGFKSIPVFRVEDTEGKELLQPDYTPPALPPLAEVAQAYGITVKYGPFTKKFYGYYRPSKEEIMLCTHDVDTFFHELAHAIHNTIKPLKGGQDTDQEIVAETVAAVLCEMFGYQGYLYHGYQYIKHYTNVGDGGGMLKAIMKVLADVQKVLQIILGSAESGKKQSEEVA